MGLALQGGNKAQVVRELNQQCVALLADQKRAADIPAGWAQQG